MPGKTLADLRRNPKHVTYRELLGVLEQQGWSVREGTLHGAIVVKNARTFLVPRAHGPHLLPVYVRRVVRMIEEED